MRIFLEAQNENEKAAIGGEAVKIEGAVTGTVILRCKEGGVLPVDHEFSWWDDFPWLLGRLVLSQDHLREIAKTPRGE